MKTSITRVLGPLLLLVLLPVIVVSGPAQAATARAVDGLTQATAAGSCWEIKQNNAQSASGIYWLVTPSLQAPQQFYCDQTTDGGGWVLVGRGRQGWKPYYGGLGTAAQVRNTVAGTAAFSPAQLPSKTIDGLLNDGSVSGLADGIRLRRAADRSGATWQETRFAMANRTRWQWTFAAQHPIGAYKFNGVGSTGGLTSDFGQDQLYRRVNTQAPQAQGYLWGFAYGTSVTGANDATSYIWSNTANGAGGRPFTQMFLRPKLQRSAMFTAATPDSGTTKQQVRQLPESAAQTTVWGVNGLANGVDTEFNTEVQSFAQVGQTVFVGGNFQNVRKNAAGTGQVAQSRLAGFNVTSGAFVTGFRPTLNGQVKALEALPDGRVAVGGDFTTVNGVSQPGLAFLNPATGALTGPQVRVETRNGAAVTQVRGLDVRNGFLYLAGQFTHLVQSTYSASAWNGGRIDLSNTRPDIRWNPAINGTSVGVDGSARGDRVYYAGYFTTVQNQSAPKVTAVQPVANAPLALAGWTPHFNSSAQNWQFDVQEVGDRFYYGGSQHQLVGYDRATLARQSGSLTRSGGDFQTITANSDTVFAGCHCGDFNYQDVYTWPQATGFTQADSINTFGAWDAATGNFEPAFNPIMKGRKGYGPWGSLVDSRGAVWVGGDYASSVRAGNVNQWSGGFARFNPKDALAPTSPSNLSKTDINSASFRLSWTGSTDNSGAAGVSYEVIEGNRVIATTSTTSAVVQRLDGVQRYFVRAVDANGNRSASTAVLNVSGAAQPAAPAAPVVTGKAQSPTAVRLSWPSQAADDGFIVKRGGSQVGTAPASSTQYDDTGLAPGTTYTYTVTAVDRGQQASSAPVHVTTTKAATTPTPTPTPAKATRPGAPIIRAASSGARGGKVTALARWAAPSRTGGAAITKYRVRALRLNNRNRVVRAYRSAYLSPTRRALTMRLPKARYTFSVMAWNRVGASTWSRSSRIVRAR